MAPSEQEEKLVDDREAGVKQAEEEVAPAPVEETEESATDEDEV